MAKILDGLPMGHKVLERFLTTLDVTVEALAICKVKQGLRLLGGPADVAEVHYVLAGTMHLMIGEAEPVICPTGSVVILPSGVSKAIAADGNSSTDIQASDHCSMGEHGLLLVDAANGGVGELRVACGLIRASPLGQFGLFDELPYPVTEDLSDVDVVRQFFAIMLEESATQRMGTRALVSSIMKACLVIVLRRFIQNHRSALAGLGAARDPRLTRAILTVLEQPSGPHSVASLALVAGMSRSTFSRCFTLTLSVTPMEFVTSTRMRHAAEMLRSTTVPVKVIAGSIGFSSRSHFSRTFRDTYGADPRAFRASCANSTSEDHHPGGALAR